LSLAGREAAAPAHRFSESVAQHFRYAAGDFSDSMMKMMPAAFYREGKLSKMITRYRELIASMYRE
jgi:hypothetical protein